VPYTIMFKIRQPLAEFQGNPNYQMRNKLMLFKILLLPCKYRILFSIVRTIFIKKSFDSISLEIFFWKIKLEASKMWQNCTNLSTLHTGQTSRGVHMDVGGNINGSMG